MARGLCRQVLSYREDLQVPQACAVLPKLAMGAPTPTPAWSPGNATHAIAGALL